MLRTTLIILLAASVLYMVSTASSFEPFLDILFTSDAVKLEIAALHGVYDNVVSNITSQIDGKITLSLSHQLEGGVYLDSTAFVTTPSEVELIAVTDDVCKACFIKGFFSRLGGLDVIDLAGFHVGYLHDNHLEVAKSLLRACDISTRCIAFKKITLQKALAELEKPAEVDAIFYFGNDRDGRLSDIHKSKVSVLSMRTLDREIASIVLPTANFQDQDIRRTFTNVVDLGQPIQVLPVFQNILYVPRGFPPRSYNYLHTLIIQRFDKNENAMERLAQNFGYEKSPQVATLSSTPRSSTEFFMDAGSMQMTFAPTIDIAGYFDTKTNTFEYDGDTLEGTPLQVGDNIFLKYQDSTHENGQYIVKAIIGGKTMMKLVNFKEGRKDESKDDRYFCVTDPKIKFKDECLSTVDHTGRVKQPDVWDAPCTISHECPFFQRDPVSKKYKGGCKDGYCEMPVGTSLVGFKNYTGKPVCKGCPRDMLNCCEYQKHPVYHFPNSSTS
jgi:hypothetical protein